MIIDRIAYKRLLDWKQSSMRKPLIMRGARQVGKTTLIRAFGKTYRHFIELNLEKAQEKALFNQNDINQLIDSIFLIKKTPNTKEDILLFIDEIQESPNAIQMLRFFYEEAPWLHVITAGSLLEFALGEVTSFPVGRVEYLYLHPFNFPEYLRATNNEVAKNLLSQIPIPEYAHQILLKEFQTYAVIGGMPEIVQTYVNSQNMAGIHVLYQAIWQAYKDDVEKYARNETQKNVIRHVIQSAPFELERIKFEGFGNSNYRSREVGEALRALHKAKIIRLMYPTTSLQLLIQTDFKKSPRIQLLDTGLLNQVLNIQSELIQLQDLDDVYRGRIIEHLIYQELISIYDYADFLPHFWVREQKNSNAEVDLVFPYKNVLVPVEIKSGATGSLRSLHQFVDEAPHAFAVRMFSGKFSIEQHTTPSGKAFTLMNLPYYLATQLPNYIAYLVDNFGADHL